MSRGRSPSSEQESVLGGAESRIAVSILDPYHDRERSCSLPSDESSPSSPTLDLLQPYVSSYTCPPAQPYVQPDVVTDWSSPIFPQQSWQSECTAPTSAASPASVLSFQSDLSLYNPSSEPFTTPSPSPVVLPLFDPRCPDQPHSTLMMHFIQTYFDHYGQTFPCLAYDETVRQFFEQSLSPLVATGIAALAAWYSDLPEVLQRGAADVSGAYCAHAKALVSRGQLASLDTVHGLILLAWAEYKRSRMVDFCSHVRTAKHFSEQIGLASGALMQKALNDYERHMLHLTWGIVRQLVVMIDTWTI
ncbi:uncharacterized protein FIBRA_01870 [Fibroporia radiculosa]|uniref:Transcription factor domain-containing protein n=1 Tax=Fibroporia radiculosa TaxID=599839 RepID=J4I8R0_9APHY|nr:uncharacterized protein FIBRA_01870 [Fibroporia radiculosa]CCL99846.1 predicted protein [Fibroporia radiculosa]